MQGYPAEYYAKRYMEHPWGNNGATVALRSLLREIRAELTDPLKRCPNCEEPGYGTLLEWPTRSYEEPKRQNLRRRYVLCVLCGHTSYVNRSSGRSRKVLSEEDQQKICDLYLSGIDAPVLARQFHVSRGTILLALKDHGVSPRPRGGSPPLKRIGEDELRRIHYLFEVRGLPQKEVAEILRLNPSTLQSRIQAMRREGWLPEAKFRSRSLALKKKAAQKRAAQGASSTASNHLARRGDGITLAKA